MGFIIKGFLLALALVSCATTEDSRYRDTSALERPPILAGNRPKGMPRVTDNSTIPKKRYEKGLGSDVYITTTTPVQLRIKHHFDYAWTTLDLALKQSKVEITDHDHDKGLYYVSYDADSSFFSKKENQAIYLLTLESDGLETKITAALGNAAEQLSAGNHGEQRGPAVDNSANQPADGAEKLLQSLYETIRDDLKEE